MPSRLRTKKHCSEDSDGELNTDESGKRKKRRHGKTKRKKPKGDGSVDPDARGGSPDISTDVSQKNRQRESDKLPPCLNPRCGGRHFISDCPKSSDKEKQEFRREYRERKRKQRESEKNGANVGAVN